MQFYIWKQLIVTHIIQLIHINIHLNKFVIWIFKKYLKQRKWRFKSSWILLIISRYVIKSMHFLMYLFDVYVNKTMFHHFVLWHNCHHRSNERLMVPRSEHFSQWEHIVESLWPIRGLGCAKMTNQMRGWWNITSSILDL